MEVQTIIKTIVHVCKFYIQPFLKHLSTLQHLLRRINDLLHLPTALLNNLLHRRARLLKLVRSGSLVQLHRAQLLLLLAARVFDRRGSFVARFSSFRYSGFARVGGRRRNVDHEEQRVGACWVWLGREGEVGALDGGGDGFDVL